ncbi:MAG: sigma 54-interacting transcriptional regulator [Phycisphaeraceae bacterium]|nr:sigma 54-interacting transcriptional regulator [Phycisphaeraceae bacterium]
MPQGWQGHFEDVLDSLDEGVLTLTIEGRIIGINRAACQILETTKAEALHLGCPCLLGEQACDAGSTLRRSIAAQLALPDFDLAMRTPSGSRKVLRLRTAVFRSAARSPAGGVVMFRDITELSQLRRDLRQRHRLHNIIGKSRSMQTVFDLIEHVAESDASVLIEGPTGTGKELVARAIHFLSQRAPGPFVPVNCSALPETLLESELFGHMRGAYTGAMRDKRGRFEIASGGSIFLDEIGDVLPATQVKLLRVLQEHTIERLGSEKSLKIDIRVIAATHRELERLVAEGQFRQDLYYRLRVVPIRLPSLAERRDDIPLLAQHFVEQFKQETGRPIEGLDADVLALLMDYPWPGNVRELENIIEYAFVKARQGNIRREHLPPDLASVRSSEPASTSAGARPIVPSNPRPPDLSRASVQEMLVHSGWNVAKAARRLGVSRTTLYQRIKTYGLKEDPAVQ